MGKDNDLCTECEKVQFRHFLVEVDVVHVGWKQRDHTDVDSHALQPTEPTKSISLSKCPVLPTNALFFNFLMCAVRHFLIELTGAT